MGEAICNLHWTPETFWACSIYELQAAFDAAAASGKKDDEDAEIARYQEFLKRFDAARGTE